MSPETTTLQAKPTTIPKHEYTWIKGANAPWDSACVRTRSDGRVYLGAKGYDRKRGGPGFISVELSAEGLKGLREALAAATEGRVLGDDSEE